MFLESVPLSSENFIDLEMSYGAPNYFPLPIVLSKGEGCWVWDVEGHKYLDMMGAYSAVSFGHSHPKILRTLIQQAQTLCVTSRAYYSDRLGLFLKKICDMTGMEKALPCNGGVEAVETALKSARRWGYEVKGIPEDSAEIIVCRNNFHGRTISVISFSTESAYRRGFGPFTAGFRSIPYGDAEALEKAITPHTAAFLVEPIQGEAGIIVPPVGYLKSCSDICERHEVLFIVDEVQSGLGRTGKNFAIEHENIQPDGLILGKALGGGILPVSLFLAREDVMSVFTPGSHGSTFGGNALASAVGLASLELLEEEKLAQRSAELGAYMISKMREIKNPLIQGVRGKGLWIGLEIDPSKASARHICERLAQNRVLSKETHETVVRFAPPLIIQKEEIEYGLAQLEKTLSSFC